MNLKKQFNELKEVESICPLEPDELRIGKCYLFHNFELAHYYIGELTGKKSKKTLRRNGFVMRYQVKFNSIVTIQQLTPTFSGIPAKYRPFKNEQYFDVNQNNSFKFYELNYTNYNRQKSEFI